MTRITALFCSLCLAFIATACNTQDSERGTVSCDWQFESNQLVGNRFNSLPSETLQVVVFYDGTANDEVLFEIELDGGSWIRIGGENPGGPIEIFGSRIETRQYQLFDCAPTGRTKISGVLDNGVVDGLAWGTLWKDQDGGYTIDRSTAPGEQAMLVGMWPLGMSAQTFKDRLVEMDGFGRESAQTIIWGAALLPNGHY